MKTRYLSRIIAAIFAVAISFSICFLVSAEESPETTTTSATTVNPYETMPTLASDWMTPANEPDVLGNAQLVEERHLVFSGGGLDFFSVTTRGGYIFYILIDHTLPDKDPNVYFLNKVDEFDLYQLLYDPDKTDVSGNAITTPVTGVNGGTVQTLSTVTDLAQNGTKKKAMFSSGTIITIVLVVIAGIALAGWMILSGKKNSPKKSTAPEYYEEDDETNE